MKKVFYSRVNRGREFLFGVPTKSIEFLNAAFAACFSLILIINGVFKLDLGLHSNSVKFNSLEVGLTLLFMSLVQFKYMMHETLESNYKSSLILKVSGLIWFIAGLTLGIDKTVNIIFLISLSLIHI